jgi:uncharacterized membrane protein SpoIIM required for sporulation/ABC-type transport system involved in multi-copper enzyme maturation permease subunit
MSPLGLWSEGWREQLSLALVITRREIRDTMRDWRLVVPIVLLTLVFPVLMNFVANFALNFVQRYGASIIGENTIPFLLMVVGFFPISFSLVIALETFVGEKERKSLEPLLATPLSNTQLYLAKTLAAMIPPVLASYLGISVYLTGLFLTINYRPPLILVLQIILLTTAEALVMVSGAVIVSSQTTSVRAANLLASFIIIPMAFLMQGEALVMFWSRYDVLWYILLALVVVDLILVRMGIRIFNREELLGREIDSINPRKSWRLFKGYLLLPFSATLPGKSLAEASGAGRKIWSLMRLYRDDVPQLLRLNWAPVTVVLLTLVAAVFIGWLYAVWYPLPAELISLDDINQDAFNQLDKVGFLPAFSTWGILTNNLRALLAAALLGVFSFGSVALVLLMAPITIVGFLTVQAAMVGYNPLVFLGAFILPHGVFELPAAIIATAMALRLGASVISPPAGMTLSQGWLRALADFVKIFVLVVVPLLVVAAFVEAHITPQVVIAVYGS